MILIIVLAGIVNYIILTYSDTDVGTKAYIMIMVALLLLWLFNNRDMNEEFDTIPTISNEAIQNLASLYNNGKLTVNNLEVTGDTKLSNWHIRTDRIGIIGGADIAYGSNTNNALNIFDYSTNNLRANGINASNLVVDGKRVSLNYTGSGGGYLNGCENGPCNGVYALIGGQNEKDNGWVINTLQ